MKTKFRNRLVAMTLAMMMTAAPIWGTAHATDTAVGDQPVKPEVESYEDNDKIEDYNKKVDEYNEAANAYNEAVDKEYEEAVAETEQKNAEIDQHNEAEAERVKAAEERNAQAEKDAAEANAKIDEENAAEEARVKEHNDNEDAKAEASAQAKKEAEEYNEAAKVHNEAVAKYTEDYAKYKEDDEQYKKDLAMEERIKAAGYTSVQHYNDTINKHYNEQAAKAKEKNASTEIKDVKDTYKVTAGSEKSGVDVDVIVKHVFEGTDVSYSDRFTIDANDVIVLNSIAALGSATQPGYATFYYKTDNNHSTGYWCESYSVLETTARIADYGWNCGDEHTVSYSQGKSHESDEEVIEMTYYYFWTPLRTAKTYNIPVAPTEPENPGAAKDMVEIPELYTPNYQNFVKKEYVKAELEEIEAANFLERIAAPVKRAYIALLAHMDLFEVPEADEETEEIITDTTVEAEVDKPAPETPEALEAPAAPETPEAPAAKATDKAAAAPAKAVKATPAALTAKAADKGTATPAKAAKAAPAAPAAKATDNGVAATAKAVEAAPAEEVQEAEGTVTEMMDDLEVPMAGTAANESWALLNLVMAILTAIASAVLMVGYFGRKENEEENENDEEKTNRKGFARLMSLIPAIGALIIFVLTENMSNPMALTDRWTILMAAILLIQAVVALASKKSEDQNEDGEVGETVNA